MNLKPRNLNVRYLYVFSVTVLHAHYVPDGDLLGSVFVK